MGRTFGAAIGALVFILFLSIIATRFAPPVSAASAQQTLDAPAQP